MENQLPNNWVEGYLYDLVQPIKTGVNKYDGEKPYYSTGSVKENKLNIEAGYSFGEKPSRANREVNKGDVLQARMLNTDKALLINEEIKNGLYSTGFMQFRPYGNTILSKYIYFYLKSEVFHTQKDILASGTTQVAINDANAKKILFPLPPLKEQQRIVAKLNSLFAHIEEVKTRLEQVPQLLNHFRQAVLSKSVSGELTFGYKKLNNLSNWEKISLGSITKLVTSGSRGWAKYYSEEGAIFVRAQNINEDYLNLNDVAYVKLEGNTEGIRTRIFENDLLITITGANVTKTAVVDFPISEAYVSQHVSLVRLENPEFSKFVYLHLISQSDGRKQLNDFAYGQGKPQLNLSNIKNVEILLPSINEQMEIVRRVEVLFSKADEIQQRYEALYKSVEVLPRAILQKAYLGELVEQLPTDGDARELLKEIEALKKLKVK
tara:strand:+ start:3666 stop:4970 length:1305 start_codon:yes stop_codon:yes gene_type:complete